MKSTFAFLIALGVVGLVFVTNRAMDTVPSLEYHEEFDMVPLCMIDAEFASHAFETLSAHRILWLGSSDSAQVTVFVPRWTFNDARRLVLLDAGRVDYQVDWNEAPASPTALSADRPEIYNPIYPKGWDENESVGLCTVDDRYWELARAALERDSIGMSGSGGLGLMAIYVKRKDFARAKRLIAADSVVNRYDVSWWDLPSK